jgi:hypothetical protein
MLVERVNKTVGSASLFARRVDGVDTKSPEAALMFGAGIAADGSKKRSEV